MTDGTPIPDDDGSLPGRWNAVRLDEGDKVVQEWTVQLKGPGVFLQALDAQHRSARFPSRAEADAAAQRLNDRDFRDD